jgi:hypothetical protein
MQWYEPLAKFLILKTINCRFPELPLRPFEMLISSDNDFPLICIGVYKGYLCCTNIFASTICSRSDRKHLSFNLLNCNSDVPWYSTSMSESGQEKLDITAMRQLDKDVALVCYQSLCYFIENDR